MLWYYGEVFSVCPHRSYAARLATFKVPERVTFLYVEMVISYMHSSCKCVYSNWCAKCLYFSKSLVSWRIRMYHILWLLSINSNKIYLFAKYCFCCRSGQITRGWTCQMVLGQVGMFELFLPCLDRARPGHCLMTNHKLHWIFRCYRIQPFIHKCLSCQCEEFLAKVQVGWIRQNCTRYQMNNYTEMMIFTGVYHTNQASRRGLQSEKC